MKEIRLKIADVFEMDPQSLGRPKEVVEVTPYILKHYAFLPKPIFVTLEGDEVVIRYPAETESQREEAARLVARAAKQATGGRYRMAIDIYKRVLELQPSFHSARRDLAMVYRGNRRHR
jgi:hypothetical protein